LAIDKADECLLVEGYTDVLALHQAGIENVVASGGTSLTPDQLRLIKKYTQNLTILYDGDNAGIKAALRGLDLALEEGLNVKLALLPNQEDPDSYINKNGLTAFTNFIKENKKDFVLFQLEHNLREAGDDTNKRSHAVNQVAETIAKINKAEDFTKQQDYIHKTAEILKIDEGGLHTLVNKYIREKLSKDEKRQFGNEKMFQQPGREIDEFGEGDADALELLNKDEYNERAVVRCLLEFGLKEWEPDKTVADHLLPECIDEEMITNTALLNIVNTYKAWYEKGLEPTPKNFLYSDNLEMSRMVVSLIEFPYEVSPNWLNTYEMPVRSREDNYKEEIISTLSYLELKKIKKLIDLNQKELETSTLPERQLLLMQTHVRLKDLETQITKDIGAVILK
jgi:DNA primase